MKQTYRIHKYTYIHRYIHTAHTSSQCSEPNLSILPRNPHDILAHSGPLALLLAVVVAQLPLLLQVRIREVNTEASLVPSRHIEHRRPERKIEWEN